MLKYTTAALVAVAVGLSARVHDGSAATKQQVKQAIRQVFGPRRSEQAICVSTHEAHLSNTAVSPTDDHGEFQINGPTWFGKVAKWTDRRGRVIRKIYVQRRFIYDPVYNARVAYVISHGGTNWNPWSVYRVLGHCHT